MNKLQFSILKEQWNARVWQITLNGIKVQTPIFMPVWTKATIKGLILDLLQDPQRIGEWIEIINIILANTFHCYLRPGDKIIQESWWIQQFEQRPGLILTDSGWFQVFSLWLKDKKHINQAHKHDINMKLTEDGVKFHSPYDWSKHLFTPEGVVDIQCNFWSDIMMMLDVCSPANDDKDTIRSDMDMTHRRAQRAYTHFERKYNNSKWVLFPIIQWWWHKDLRDISLQALTPFAKDGIAVWWVSVWESRDKIEDIVQYLWPKLPKNKPRYLMGVWTPQDLLFAIEQGFDMFDCVLATRLGRHGVMFSDDGNLHITNARFKNDHEPFSTLSPKLSRYSRAYVHHLIKEWETLWWILLSVHNIVYLHKMLSDRKQKVLQS